MGNESEFENCIMTNVKSLARSVKQPRLKTGACEPARFAKETLT